MRSSAIYALPLTFMISLSDLRTRWNGMRLETTCDFRKCSPGRSRRRLINKGRVQLSRDSGEHWRCRRHVSVPELHVGQGPHVLWSPDSEDTLSSPLRSWFSSVAPIERGQSTALSQRLAEISALLTQNPSCPARAKE